MRTSGDKQGNSGAHRASIGPSPGSPQVTYGEDHKRDNNEQSQNQMHQKHPGIQPVLNRGPENTYGDQVKAVSTQQCNNSKKHQKKLF